jgi:mono/diheme cytochrome c family protein
MIGKWLLVVLGVAAAAAIWLWPGSPGHTQVFGLADYSGEEIFQRFCASCHGPEGAGDGPVAASLNVVVPDLTRLAERRGGVFPAADVRELVDGRAVVVAHGPRTMPVWGYEFWVEEGADIAAEREARNVINRLVAFIAEIQGGEPDPAVPR